MGTRSIISIKNEDQTFDAVYCHWDGYPKGVGETLKKSYTTEEKIRELIAGGDMSCLKDEINDCEFYTKRGEELHNYKNFKFDDLLQKAQDIGCEYLYSFYGDEWRWVEF